jgi:hypothetical protein
MCIHQQSSTIIITVTNVSSGRVAKKNAAQKAAKAAPQPNAFMQNYLAHPIEQQQTALSLVQLAKQQPDMNLGEGKVSALIFGLTVRIRPLPWSHTGLVLITGANTT